MLDVDEVYYILGPFSKLYIIKNISDLVSNTMNDKYGRTLYCLGKYEEIKGSMVHFENGCICNDQLPEVFRLSFVPVVKKSTG